METAWTFIDRQMDKENVVHVYNRILLSHKENETMPFVAARMQLEVIILSEISQKEKNKYRMTSLTCET